jgi:two-component system, NarL family, sensor histidine kinase UhpB
VSADAFWLSRWLASVAQQGKRRWPLSIFEKVILANSAIILLETIAGWWITQHNPETYHYLIDTGFIALAALLGMTLNFLILRAAFAPLHGLLTTIQAVEAGDLDARAVARARDAEVWTLARAFNAMLGRLSLARHDAAGRVLRAQEEERRRLALELHDQIGQSLTALTLHAEAIAQRLAGETSSVAGQAHRQAERLTTLAQRTLAEVQALSRQLRPPLLDDVGLRAALRWLVEDVSERFGVRVQVRDERSSAPSGDAPLGAGGQATEGAEAASVPMQPLEEQERLPGEVETALFRIAQESLTNAIRHGHAQQIAVTLWQGQAEVTLTVADDGKGFAPQSGEAPEGRQGVGQGVGLEGMRERAQLLGGTLHVRSHPGHGCVVRVQVPLPSAASPGAVLGPSPAAAAPKMPSSLTP